MGRNETSNFRLLFMISGTSAFSLFLKLANIVSRPCCSCKLSILAFSEAGGDPVLTETSLLFNCKSKTTKSPQPSLSFKRYVTQRATKSIDIMLYIREWRRTGRGRGLKVMRRFSKFLQLMLQTQLLVLSIFQYIDRVFNRCKLVTCI